MAKKKTTKVSEKSTSFQQAIGIDNIFHNERINFVLGFCLLFIAGYLTWAFASFLVTGEADQSMIEVPRAGEIPNWFKRNRKQTSWLATCNKATLLARPFLNEGLVSVSTPKIGCDKR